jgi:2'-5' RNA ligase
VPTAKNLDRQYFIAIIPPKPVYEEALEQKEYFKEHYNSKASLNSPPHITLHMPFRWKENDEEKLAKQLAEFANANHKVDIKLSNFSSFPPRVIFIDVERNAALEQLQKSLQRHCRRNLNLLNADYKERAFRPHLTVAFRDLKKPSYQKAWEEFKRKHFQASFTADKLTLIKHSGRYWTVHRDFMLQ